MIYCFMAGLLRLRCAWRSGKRRWVLSGRTPNRSSELAISGSCSDNPGLEWETDPHVLQEALLNLIRNAADAIGDACGRRGEA